MIFLLLYSVQDFPVDLIAAKLTRSILVHLAVPQQLIPYVMIVSIHFTNLMPITFAFMPISFSLPLTFPVTVSTIPF